MGYDGANKVGSDPLGFNAGESFNKVVDVEDARVVKPAF